MDLSAYEKAAARYAPSKTLVLFVAESPPASIDRYFYYPDVEQQDSLWVELMKALYGDEFRETRDERPRKRYWLARFQADGYRLIDAVKEPGPTTDAAIRSDNQFADRVGSWKETSAPESHRLQRRRPASHSTARRRVIELISDRTGSGRGSTTGCSVPCGKGASPWSTVGKLPFPGSGQQT